MKKMISIIAPMYNEEALVKEYCMEAREMILSLQNEYDFELILINDGSRDETYHLMLEEQQESPELISVISLTRNFGLEGAVNAGLKKAVGDAVVVMDADLQDPLSLIPIMIGKWEDGADIVVGSRIKRSNDRFFKKLGANIYYKVLDKFSGKLKLEKSAANFRLISRKALIKILSLPEVNTVFRVVVPFVGMKTDVVEYHRDKRYAGKTKYNLKSMIPYALDSITSISVEPLRKIYIFIPLLAISFCVSIICAIVVTSSIWKVFWLIITALSVLFGILIITLSIMGEYMAQIMTEVKGRPISIIYDYKPSLLAQKSIKGE